VLGVAPYVQEVLADIPLRRFESVLELGADDVAAPRMRAGRRKRGPAVLHVGRAVRTKGLRDAVRALAQLPDLPGVTLTSAGAGEELAPCRAEAARLGLAHRVTFLGRVPRARSRRSTRRTMSSASPPSAKPAGGVLYEAMRHGLPVVTADRGGPGWIVDDASGLRIPVTDPETYARDIAAALRRLAEEPGLSSRLGRARGQGSREGLWSAKAARMVALYADIAATELRVRPSERIWPPVRNSRLRPLLRSNISWLT
jgi:glycosyltransferase involved in cell wall biosynthesis